MKLHEVMDINNRTMPKGKEAKAEMRSMEYEKSANGGHVFTHRMHDMGSYREPEKHTFGPDEGSKALEHFAKHSGLSEHLPAADEDSAAGAAT